MRPRLVGQRDEHLVILLTDFLADGFQSFVEREEGRVDVALRKPFSSLS